MKYSIYKPSKTDYSINTTLSTNNAHPVSTKFIRLNLLEPNTKLKNWYWETEDYSCSDSNTAFCIQHTDSLTDTTVEEVVFCKNTKTHQYNDLLSIPVNSSCVDTCAANKLCTDNCYSELTNCSVKTCLNSATRWFDNKCLVKDDDEFYSIGALYHSNLFTTPEFKINTTELDSFILSFWYYPETNADLTVGNDYSNDFKNYFFYSENLKLYVMNNAVFAEFGQYEEQISGDNAWRTGFWIHFVVDSDDQKTIIRAKSLNIDFIYRTSSAIGLNGILFKQFDGETELWNPGYYKFFEVFDNQYINLYELSQLRNYFSMFDSDKLDYAEFFPKHIGLTNVVSLVNKQVLLPHYASANTLADDKFYKSYYDISTQSKIVFLPSDAVDAVNQQFFNYGIVREESNNCPEFCEKCGGDECYKCIEGYFASNLDGKCYYKHQDNNYNNNSNNFYLRLPFHYEPNTADPVTNNDTIKPRLDLLTASETFSFSIDFKILGFTKVNAEIFSLGKFKLSYDYDTDKLYLSNDLTELFSIFNFRNNHFGKWINIAISVDLSTKTLNNSKHINFYVNYAYHTIINPSFTLNNVNNNNDTINSNFNLVFSNEFIGLISTVYYDKDNYIKPAYLLSKDNSMFSEFFSLTANNCLSNGSLKDIANGTYKCVSDFEEIDHSCKKRFMKNNSELNEHIMVDEYEKNTYPQSTQILEAVFGPVTRVNYTHGNNYSKNTSIIDFIQMDTLYTCSINNNFDIFTQEAVGKNIPGTEDLIFAFMTSNQHDDNYEAIVISYYVTEDLEENQISIALCAKQTSDNRCADGAWKVIGNVKPTKGNRIEKLEFSIKKRAAPSVLSEYYAKFNNNEVDLEGLSENSKLFVSFSPTGSDFSSNKRRFLTPFNNYSGVINSLRLTKLESFVIQESNVSRLNFLKSAEQCMSDEDCLLGHFCLKQIGSPSQCMKCWPGCDRCDFFYTSSLTAPYCKINSKCSYLSDFQSTVTDEFSCDLDYLDIASYDSDIIDITDIEPDRSAGYTVGFWIFTSELENTDTTTSSAEYTIHLDEIMSVKLHNKSIGTGVNKYDSLNIVPTIYHIERTQKNTSDDVYRRWVHIKVGFHAENVYKDGEQTYNAFIDTVYYKDHDLVRQKHDFFVNLKTIGDRTFQKIFACDERFFFKISKQITNNHSLETYIREIAVFKDLMRSNYEDYDLTSLVTKIQPLYFYIPLNNIRPSHDTINNAGKIFYNLHSQEYTRRIYIDALEVDAAHPVSAEFTRLNLFVDNSVQTGFSSINTRFENKYFEIEEFACHSDSLLCVKNASDAANVNVFCNNNKNTMQYTDLQTIPVQSICTNDCEANQLCTNLCQDYENDCTQRCDSNTNLRWFDNKCYDKDNHDLYNNAAMYYSHQFSSPELAFSVDPISDYILSFWFFPESNNEFLFGVNQSNKNYILFTNSNGPKFYIQNNKFYATIAESVPVELGNLVTRQWYNFSLHRKGGLNEFNVVNVNGISETKSTTTINAGELSSINFTKNIPANSSWYPGFYKYLEVLDSTYITNSMYLSFRTFFNIYENNKSHLRAIYPDLTHFKLLVPMTSWFVTDPLKNITNELISEEFDHSDFYQKYHLQSIYSQTQQVIPTYECKSFNQYFFNYSIVKNEKDCADVYCEECNKDVCFKCRNGYYQNNYTKKCEEFITSRKTYFRSPLIDSDNTLIQRADTDVNKDLIVRFNAPVENVISETYSDTTPYELTFSVFLKPLVMKKLVNKVLDIGELKITFTHENDKNYFIVTPKKSYDTNHAVVEYKTEFKYQEFDTWVNLSFSFYRNFYKQEADLLKLAPSMMTFQYQFEYSRHNVFDKILIDDISVEDESFRDLQLNNFILSNDYVGLIANFRYIHRYMYQPSAIVNYNAYSTVDLYVLSFAGSDDKDCIHVDKSTNLIDIDYNNEFSKTDEKYMPLVTCAYSDAPEFFEDCEFGYSKVSDEANTVPDNEGIYKSTCRKSNRTVKTCQYTYRNLFKTTNDEECACLSSVDDFMLCRNDKGDYSCIPHDRQINILAYTPIKFEDYNRENLTTSESLANVYEEYAIEMWFYLKAFTKFGMKGLEFQWANQLRLRIDQTANQLNVFEVKCYPRYVSNTIGNNSINNQSQTLSNFESKWYHIRCSISLPENKFVFTSNIHESAAVGLVNNTEKSSTNSLNNFQFIAHNQRMIASGRMFIRQLRLWKCYYCYEPMINYRAILNNLDHHAISDYFADKVINSWDSFELDGEYKTTSDDVFPNAITNTNNNLHINSKYYRITFEDRYTIHEIDNVNTSDEIIYINRKAPFADGVSMDEIKDPEYLVTMDEYYTKRHLANLADYSDIDDKITNIPAPKDGRYTVEFYFKHDESLSHFNSGINIILENTISIAVKSRFFAPGVSTDPSLMVYCFPQEYKVKLERNRMEQVDNLFNQALNKASNEFKTYNRQWVHYRCAVSENDDEYYFARDSAKDTEIYAFNKIETWRKVIPNEQINKYEYGTEDVIFRRFVYPNETIKLSINGAKDNTLSSRIYLRNFYYFNEYLPRNVVWDKYNINDLNYFDIPSRVLSIDFSKLDFMRTDTTLNYVLSGQEQTVQLLKSRTLLSEKTKFIDYTFNVPSACNNNREFLYVNNKEQCYNTICNTPYSNCRADNIPLVCPTGTFLLWTDSNGYICTDKCHGYGITSKVISRQPGISPSTRGGFCNFTCDGSKYKADSKYTRLCECDSSYSNTNLSDNLENFLCPPGLYRFGYKCWDKKTAEKGRIYFNECYDTPNMVSTVGNTNDEKVDYTFGFWFKLDNINNECSWKPSTKKDANGLYTVANRVNRHLLYTNLHTIYRNVQANTLESKNQIFYEIPGYITKTTININHYSWNQITIYVKNKTIKDISIHVNFGVNKIDSQMNLNDVTGRPLNLLLTKIAFCGRPNCLNSEDNIKQAAAYYKDLFYLKTLNVDFDLLKDRTFSLKHVNYYNFPLNLLHSDRDMFRNQFRNNGNTYFRPSDSTYNTNTEKSPIVNYSTLFDWEEDNLGNVITNENSVNAFTTTSCNNIFAADLATVTTSLSTVGCARCFNASTCYRCYDEPEAWTNNYYLENNRCVKNVNVYTELPPISGTETAQHFDAITLPLNPTVLAENQRPFNELTQFTFTIFIKYKALIEGVCIENPLIEYHENLIVCYDEPTDSIILGKRNGNQLAIVSNFTANFRNKWIFFGLSVRSARSVGISDMMSFSVNQNDIGTVDSGNLLVPPSNLSADYYVKLFYKNKALLYDFRVYNTFILKPYGYVNNTNYRNLYLHYAIPLFSPDVDVEINTSSLCINRNLNGLPYLPKFKCSFDSGFNFYQSSTCSVNNFSVFSNSGILSCQKCASNCLKGCSDAFVENCSYDNVTGHAILQRKPESNNGQILNYVTVSKNLEFIDINRYSSGSVSGVKRSSTSEYTMDFWFFMKFYNPAARDALFKNVSVIWDGHVKIDISLKTNAAGNKQVDMDCYLAFNSNRVNEQSNSLKKDGYLNIIENKWTHLQCGVRLRDYSEFSIGGQTFNKKYYTTQNGEQPFVLDNYTFETAGTTTFSIKNNSLPNFGLMFIANVNMWETFGISKIDLSKCKITNPAVYIPLLHSVSGRFNGEQSILIVKNVHASGTQPTQISSPYNQHPDFSGYGVINNLTAEFSQADLRTCPILNVNPYSKQGENNVTPFNFECISDTVAFPAAQTQFKYGLLNSDSRVDITNNVNYIFNLQENGQCVQPTDVIELQCIINYGSSIDILSEILLIERDRISNLRDVIVSINASLDNNPTIELVESSLNELLTYTTTTGDTCEGTLVSLGETTDCRCSCGVAAGGRCISQADMDSIQDLITKTKAIYDNLVAAGTERRRRLQISNNYGAANLAILHNLMKASIDIRTVEFVNSNYLDQVDRLLYNPTQDNIVKLIADDYNKFFEVVDTLYTFYNRKLRDSQNEIFFKYLETNEDPRIIFDVSFITFNSFEVVVKNYTQILNFEKVPEYNDPNFIMSLQFTDYLIEARNKIVKEGENFDRFSQFEKFFDRVNVYLTNIAHIAITNNQFRWLNRFNNTNANTNSTVNNSNQTLRMLQTDNSTIFNLTDTFEEQDPNWQYKFVSSNFIVDLRRVNKNFDFRTLAAGHNRRSYFDASSLMKTYSFNNFFLYLITFTSLPENYYANIQPLSGNINFQIYDQNVQRISNANTRIRIFLHMIPESIFDSYYRNNTQKYVAGYMNQLQNVYSDIIRQPYYIDEDGNIDHSTDKVSRIIKYHPDFEVKINSNSDLFLEITSPYVVGLTTSSGRFFANYVPYNAEYKDYDHDYFWFRPKLYRRSENYRLNPSLYVIICSLAIIILLFILFLVYRVVIKDAQNDAAIMDEGLQELNSKLALNEKLNFNELEENHYQTTTKNVEGDLIKETEVYKPNRYPLYSMSFWDAFVNLVSTNRFYGIYTKDTFVDPKYRRILNFWFFYVLWYLFFSLLLTFNEINLLKSYEQYIQNVVGYFFASYGLAYLANIIMVAITRDGTYDKDDLQNGIELKNTSHNTAIERIKLKNTIRSVVLLTLNLMLSTLLFYSAIGFSAYWVQYRGIMEVCVPIMFAVDFLAADVILSFIMAILYSCRCQCLFRFLKVFKFPRCL